MRSHVGAKNRIDTRLIARSCVFEKVNRILIDAQLDKFLCVWEVNRLHPNSVGAKRRIAGIDLVVRHCCNCLKLCTFARRQRWRILEVKG